MPLTEFVTKFYSFPSIEKPKLRDFLLSDDVDMWIVSNILIPVDKTRDFLALIATNKLSIFDKIEQELLGQEIDISEFAKAARRLGSQYESFYPSVNISHFF